METTKKLKRLDALRSLIAQYNELKKSERGWPDKFRAQGLLVQCNFGGLLIILNNSWDAAVVWSDWSGDAISDKFEVTEIFTDIDPDATEPGQDLINMVYYQGGKYRLDEFMRIDRPYNKSFKRFHLNN